MPEKYDPLKSAELTTEQNYNMIDGILNNGPAPETRPCPVCGRPFLPDGRTRYCSTGCAHSARLKKQRGYMRKYRG